MLANTALNYKVYEEVIAKTLYETDAETRKDAERYIIFRVTKRIVLEPI